MRMGADVVCRLAVLTQIPRVALDRFALVVTHTLRIGLYKTAIEDAAGQAFVVVGFDGFEIVHRDSRLFADLTQTDASLLACESQLFAYTRCYVHSLDSWYWLVGLLTQVYQRAACMNAYNSHFFCTIACAAKRCQTFVSQKICVSCFLSPAVVR